MIEQIKLKKNSDTVFIIGGGSSLTKTLPNPSIIVDKDIIATNYAYDLFPNAMVLLFADKSWYVKHMLDIQNRFKGIIISSTNMDKEYYLTNKVDHVFFRGEDYKISEVCDKLNGGNSGHLAINLAMFMGYRKIVLIGFDMNDKVKQTHWHDKHNYSVVTSRYREVFIPAFSSITPYQVKFGCEIYNLNKESCITSFKFADLQDFI
jgi:hypothetical protein